MTKKENKQGCLGCIFFIVIIVGLSLVFADFMLGDTIYSGEVIVDVEENIKYEFDQVRRDGNVRDIVIKENEVDLKEEHIVNFVEILYNYYNRTDEPVYVINVYLSGSYVEKDKQIVDMHEESQEGDSNTDEERLESLQEELQRIRKTDFLIQAVRNDSIEKRDIVWQQEKGRFQNLYNNSQRLNDFEVNRLSDERIITKDNTNSTN